MNTIFRKRGLVAVLLLSASVSNIIPMDGPPSAPYPPSSASSDEGSKKSWFSGCFGGGKKTSSPNRKTPFPSSQPPFEGSATVIDGEGSAKEACCACKFYTNNTGRFAAFFAVLAAGLGAVAYKFHRDGKASQEFDYFDDKISDQDSADAIEKENKGSKFKEKLFGIGAVAFGVLALLSGLKFRTQSQRIKDLEEALSLLEDGSLKLPAAAETTNDCGLEKAKSKAKDGICQELDELKAQQIESFLDEVRLSGKMIRIEENETFEQIKKQCGSNHRARQSQSSVNGRIKELKSQLAGLYPPEKLLSALHQHRAAKAERIKAEKAWQAVQAKHEKGRQQQPPTEGAASFERPVHLFPEKNGQNLPPAPSPLPIYPHSYSSSSASCDRPSCSSSYPRHPGSTEFSPSPLPPQSGQHLRDPLPTTSSSSTFSPSETTFGTISSPFPFPSDVSLSDPSFPSSRPLPLLGRKNSFNVSEVHQQSSSSSPANFSFFSTPTPPLHFGNPQSETLSSAPSPATTHVPSGFPLNPQGDCHFGGTAGYPPSSSSSTPGTPLSQDR